MKSYYLDKSVLDKALASLRQQGKVIGPQVVEGVITYQALESAEQLPWGIVDEQQLGLYRLHKADPRFAFMWANGPQAIKPWLFKPKETLWKVERDEQGKLAFKTAESEIEPLVLFGVRSCDLAAMRVQDKVFIHDRIKNKQYQQRREALFIIAVNCSRSGNNCFCVSTGDGPEAKSDYDWVMTELEQGFIVTAGSAEGEKLLKSLQLPQAKQEMIQQAIDSIAAAAVMQSKQLPKSNLRDLLYNNLDHPQWDNVAERCLSCGNCTSVCPTCFCSHESEEPSIKQGESTHIRQWDSCFTAGHSYAAGRVHRESTKARYKQWLVHKLGTWWDQFDTSGCIGCGRCITWCPVGIDITEEIAALEK